MKEVERDAVRMAAIAAIEFLEEHRRASFRYNRKWLETFKILRDQVPWDGPALVIPESTIEMRQQKQAGRLSGNTTRNAD